MSDSLLGQQLDEYRLEALLGHGGMARVYRGLDLNLKRYAAIKVIDTPFRAESDYIQRFEREAQAIAQLHHPHIVSLYRYGKAQSVIYMAMQYIEGADLAVVLNSYREDAEFMDFQDVMRIIHEVCLALDYMHSKGVIHRDIKPSNVLLDKQGRAILTDFGLVLLTEVGTRGQIFGSPHYIAPEQAISSAGAVPQSDLYAVGVTLYEMLTNEVPFDAEEPMDLAMMHMTDLPRPLRELRPEIGPEAEAVTLKALAKDPRDRYPNGAALADALEQALIRGLPVSSSTPTVPRITIPERVAVEVAQNPLPSIPAAVATPPPMRTTPHPTSAVTVLASTRPVAKQKTLVIYTVAGAVAVLALTILLIALNGLVGGGEDDEKAFVVDNTPADLTEDTIPPTGFTQSGDLSTATVDQAVTPRPTFTPLILPTLTPTSPLPLPFTPTTEAPLETPETIQVSATPSTPIVYVLAISRAGKKGLVIVNWTPQPFPLVPLRLGNEDGEVDGVEWGVDMLENSSCVEIIEDRKNDEEDLRAPANVTCYLVGAKPTRKGKARFWESTFLVYYNQVVVGTCVADEAQCLVRISRPE
jgi:serine/threonine protein kinase